MAEIAELMRAHLFEVFAERDADRRRAAIARVYAPDVEFSDPEGTVTGHAALDAKVATVLDGAPEFVFSATGPVGEVSDLGHLTWGFGPAGQPPVVRGVDVALVRDGRITRAYTLLQAD